MALIPQYQILTKSIRSPSSLKFKLENSHSNSFHCPIYGALLNVNIHRDSLIRKYECTLLPATYMVHYDCPSSATLLIKLSIEKKIYILYINGSSCKHTFTVLFIRVKLRKYQHHKI
jgi:hypothetical protein